jgi:hypothetical protein
MMNLPVLRSKTIINNRSNCVHLFPENFFEPGRVESVYLRKKTLIPCDCNFILSIKGVCRVIVGDGIKTAHGRRFVRVDFIKIRQPFAAICIAWILQGLYFGYQVVISFLEKFVSLCAAAEVKDELESAGRCGREGKPFLIQETASNISNCAGSCDDYDEIKQSICRFKPPTPSRMVNGVAHNIKFEIADCRHHLIHPVFPPPGFGDAWATPGPRTARGREGSAGFAAAFAGAFGAAGFAAAAYVGALGAAGLAAAFAGAFGATAFAAAYVGALGAAGFATFAALGLDGAFFGASALPGFEEACLIDAFAAFFSGPLLAASFAEPLLSTAFEVLGLVIECSPAYSSPLAFNRERSQFTLPVHGRSFHFWLWLTSPNWAERSSFSKFETPS